MGSGEGDAIREVKLDTSLMSKSNTYVGTVSSSSSSGYYDSFGIWHPYGTYSWITSYPIYKWQITCPVKGCKTMNWGAIDEIISCRGCGAKLKAVDKKVDYEIEVA